MTLATFPKHSHGVFAQSPKAALTVMSQNLKWFSHHLLDHDLDWDKEDPLEGYEWEKQADKQPKSKSEEPNKTRHSNPH